MNQFYVSIIFIGIMLLSVSLVWIFVDRRQARQAERILGEKHEKVIQAIEDAEEIVHEINRFSDYVSEKVEEDGKKIESLLQKVDEKLEQYTLKIDSVSTVSISQKSVMLPPQKSKHNQTLENIAMNKPSHQEHASVDTHTEKEVCRKVIPIHNRYIEVIEMAKQGFTQADIAKQLHMGQGEIQLILGLKTSNITSKTG